MNKWQGVSNRLRQQFWIKGPEPRPQLFCARAVFWPEAVRSCLWLYELPVRESLGMHRYAEPFLKGRVPL